MLHTQKTSTKIKGFHRIYSAHYQSHTRTTRILQFYVTNPITTKTMPMGMVFEIIKLFRSEELLYNDCLCSLLTGSYIRQAHMIHTLCPCGYRYLCVAFKCTFPNLLASSIVYRYKKLTTAR